MHFGLALWGWSLLEFSTILLGNPSSPRCCCFSVAQSCLTLCNLMDCSTPGFPVHHQLPELAQTHVHQVGDAIQPSHPLLSPSPTAFSLLYGPTLTLVHDYGKTITFTTQTFVGKVMSLLFNMLSRFVLAILPRSK